MAKKIALSLMAMFAISVSLFAQNDKGHTAYLEEYQQRVANALNPVSAERVIYHVLLDGPMDYEEKGWSFKFTKAKTSSDGFSTGGVTNYVLVATTTIPTINDTVHDSFEVREVRGINHLCDCYEHTIGVKIVRVDHTRPISAPY